MDPVIFIARLAIALLAAIGFLSTIKFSVDNGTIGFVQENTAKYGPLLRGLDYSFFLTRWTGETAFDLQISVVTNFWNAIADTDSVSLKISTFYYLTQQVAIWMLVMVEAHRVANAWSLISLYVHLFLTAFSNDSKGVSSVTIIGILGENLGMGLAVPSYFAFYLATSPIARRLHNYPAATRKTMLLVHPTELNAIPWSVMMGYGIPTLMIFFCKEDTTQPLYLTRTFWILVRQACPILIGILQLGLSILSSDSGIAKKPANERNRAVMSALSGTYAAIILIASFSHLSTVVATLISLFAPPEFAKGMLAQKIGEGLIDLPIFWHSMTVVSLEQGILYFIRWSTVTVLCAPLIWAFALNRSADADEQSSASAQTPSFGKLILQWLVRLVVGGPVAAAVMLIKDRDEALLLSPNAPDDKIKKQQ